MAVRAAIVTISDRSSRGEREDISGPEIRQALASLGDVQIVESVVIPDERDTIEDTLKSLADIKRMDLILTTGGTGLAPRDVTPEATRAVIEKEAPGIATAMVVAGLKVTPMAMLSRAVAGVRGQSLIINLPGSPKAVRENLAVVLPVLSHALAIIQDRPAGH